MLSNIISFRKFNGSNLTEMFFLLFLPGTLFVLTFVNEMVNLFVDILFYHKLSLSIENPGQADGNRKRVWDVPQN
jgi:hypothetical protein